MDTNPYPRPDTRMFLRRAVTFKNLKSPNKRVQDCYRDAEKIAKAGEGVLIEGESGTGKDQVALAMRNASPYAQEPLVEVNCGAIPESLLEAEIFGCEKWSYTDGKERRLGCLREADGGVLLLSDSAEIPPARQKAFLRALQLGKFRPLGANREVEAHFTLYMTSNRLLQEMVARGEFRLDLMMRVNRHRIWLPPLREHPEDILPSFLERYGKECLRQKRTEEPLTSDLVAMLEAYSWPGNLREVTNVASDAASLGLRRAIEGTCHAPSTNGVPAVRGPQPGEDCDDWRVVRRRHVWRVWLACGKDYQQTMRRVRLGQSAVYQCIQQMRRELGEPAGP